MPSTTWLLTAFLLISTATTTSHAAGPPVQSAIAILMPSANGESRRTVGELQGGTARVSVRATNVDVRTVKVTMRFEYTVPPDTIALDEIIDHIAVETASATMIFGRVRVDPNEVNLNPNKSPLVYQVTLYRPAGEYRVRVRTYGNYE